MQLSSLVGVPLLAHSGFINASNKDIAISIASGYWAVISFPIALFLVLYFMKEDMKYSYDRHQASIGMSFFWAIGGFCSLFSPKALQLILRCTYLVSKWGENTRRIVEMVKLTPALILVTSVVRCNFRGNHLSENYFRDVVSKIQFFLISARQFTFICCCSFRV